MKVNIDVELQGLGEVLAELLPKNATPTSVRLTDSQLRIELEVPIAFMRKSVALTARVQRSPGSLRLHGFEMEGAMGFGDTVIAELRKSIANLDERHGPFHLKGGDGLVVSWA